MLEANHPYIEQVRLLVHLLPSVAKQACFALKGGTAINLFFRDMSTDKENDGNMRENGQEQRGREDGAPSRSLARA